MCRCSKICSKAWLCQGCPVRAIGVEVFAVSRSAPLSKTGRLRDDAATTSYWRNAIIAPTGVTFRGRSQFSGTPWTMGEFLTAMDRERECERERDRSISGSCRLLDSTELQAMWQAHLTVAWAMLAHKHQCAIFAGKQWPKNTRPPVARWYSIVTYMHWTSLNDNVLGILPKGEEPPHDTVDGCRWLMGPY